MRCLSFLSALAVVLLASAAPVRAACPGDCDGGGVVSIDELIRLVDIGLNGEPPISCPAGDLNADGSITIEELIAAVSAALAGCPATPTGTAPNSPTATQTAAATVTVTGELPATATSTVPAVATATASPVPTATASLVPSVTATAAPTSTGDAEASATATAEPSATPPATGTATPTRSASASPTRSATAPGATSTTTVPPATGSATVTFTPTRTRTHTATPPATASATRTPTTTRSATPTRSLTPSSTPTFTITPTPGLGVRRFSLNPQSSSISLLPTFGEFDGFSGHLDLAARAPDPVTGLAIVDIVGASEFLSVEVGDVRLCLKPVVPILRAGVLACNGGVDLGVGSAQDHNIGVVGVDGFTAPQCAAAGGIVEAANEPHPGVCNGPVDIVASPQDDSGVGALMIAPDVRFATEGLVADVTIDEGDCNTHGAGDETVFGFVSGISRATISDANNVAGATFQHDEAGQNFSCAQWMQENGPGRLVLSVPAVHGTTSGDLITVFVLDD